MNIYFIKAFLLYSFFEFSRISYAQTPANDTNWNKDIFDFSLANSNGGSPFGDLLLSGNVFYGMTQGNGGMTGCIFSINTNGSAYKDLYDFSVNSGAFPDGSLAFSQGTLYGTTSQGGTNNLGVIFSVNTDGPGYKDLFDFRDMPCSLTPLIIGNILYETKNGRTNNSGNIFSLQFK